jgi:DNA processing protein
LAELDTRFALMLSQIDGIGPVRYQNIIKLFNNYESFLSVKDESVLTDSGFTESLISRILKFDRWDKVDKILEQANSSNVTIICLGQKDYPEILTNVYAPPLVLYMKGELDCLSRPAVAVVGSRTPTHYGRLMTDKIVSGLASKGILIISGLAWGIDAQAHQAAINVGGSTAAVFGSGIDILYPGNHRELADKILEHGCWLSEFPFGTKPERHNFPRRNRIISGLSQAVIVVEAAAKSGALVTAGLALEQGREVFAVPGQADSPMSGGTINLIKDGASVATSADDILASLGWVISQKAEASEAVQEKPNTKLEPDEQKICDLVGGGAAHVDEIIRKLGFSSAKVAAILLKLELAGLVVRRPGNYVART